MQQIYRRTPCWSAISIKLQSNFIEIVLWQWCSPVNLLHFFRTPFSKNTSGWLLLTSLKRNSSTVVFSILFSRFFKDAFFSIWVFLSRAFTIHRIAGERGEGIYLTSLYHFNLLHRHLDIGWAITARGLPLRIATSQTRAGNLSFPGVSR